MSDHPVVIIGAGLAGLAAGYSLARSGVPYVILEKGPRPGGLCRTESIGGYTFDYTGHLLHLKEGESRDLLLSLIGDRMSEHDRKASIYVEDTFVPYPVQAHFGALSPATARACMEELKALSMSTVLFQPVSGQPVSGEMSFDNWAVAQFGRTLAELFMIPYNQKLYCHPLDEMETSWTSWSIPRPTVEEIERIASGEEPSFGYNASFYYPDQGGIELLPMALAKGQESGIRTGGQGDGDRYR